jgi:hypothetical protein
MQLSQGQDRQPSHLRGLLRHVCAALECSSWILVAQQIIHCACRCIKQTIVTFYATNSIGIRVEAVL